MPLNLHALIRYRTLNDCFASIRNHTIAELVDRCSDALTEYKGMPTSVSERTIREDIRVMRSGVLGFEAPIEQKEGRYFYSDRSFTLYSGLIRRDPELLNDLLNLLEELNGQVDHPGLPLILNQLKQMLETARIEKASESVPENIIMHSYRLDRCSEDLSGKIPKLDKKYLKVLKEMHPRPKPSTADYSHISRKNKDLPSIESPNWGWIFDELGKGKGKK